MALALLSCLTKRIAGRCEMNTPVTLRLCTAPDVSDEICNDIKGKEFIVAYKHNDEWHIKYNKLSLIEAVFAGQLIIKTMMGEIEGD